MFVVLIVTGIGVIVNMICYVNSKKNGTINLIAATMCLTIFLCSAFSLAIYNDSPTEYVKVEYHNKEKKIKIESIEVRCDCGNLIWNSEKFCDKCGHKKDYYSDEITSICYDCPKCKRLASIKLWRKSIRNKFIYY